MINYDKRYLFRRDSVDKQFEIIYDYKSETNFKVIKNSDLYQGEFELTETLCSEKELRFGACESSSIKFKIANGGRASLIGKKLDVYITLNGDKNNKFKLGTYFVDSDKETADRNAREIIAYDAMKQIIERDVAKWFKKFWNGKTSSTIEEIRTDFFNQSFIKKLGITMQSINLPNDSTSIKKTIDAEKLSGVDFLRAVCEINGVFGHIGRDNEFKFVRLPIIDDGLYPAETLYPSSNLFPKDSGANDSIGKSGYIKCEYESFITVPIDHIQIRKEEGDIGGSYPTAEDDYKNSYVIEDNFFVYGFTTDRLNIVSTRLRDYIIGRTYRPSKIELVGDPTLEVGDAIRVVSEREIFVTFVLERTLKGIQSLKDTFSAKGVENYGEKANSWQSQIIQLKNRTNIAKRTADESYNKITQEISDRESADAELQLTATDFAVRLNASSVVWDERISTSTEDVYNIKYRGNTAPSASVVKKPSENDYYLNQSNGYLYQYKNSAWSKVKNLKEVTKNLSSQLILNASEISAKVSSSGGTASTFSWSLTENGFYLKSNNKTVFECTAERTKIGGGTTYTWDIGVCEVKVNDTTRKYSAIWSGKDAFESSSSGIYLGTDGIALGSRFKVDRSGNLSCSNADVSGKITATSGSFSGDVTCKSLTLGDGVHLTDSMFKNNTISGARLVNGSVGSTQVSSISANKVSAGVINGRNVQWQRITYMEGLNWTPVYMVGGSLTTTAQGGLQPVGYIVNSISSNSIFTLAQANAPKDT